ncbi:GT-D fold domain-containing glycosyltransferase [Arthrobacter sp. TmT3-37]
MSDPNLEAILAPLTEIRNHLATQNKLIEHLLAEAKKQNEVTAKLQVEAILSRQIQESMRKAVAAPLLTRMRESILPRQLGFLETLQAIKRESLSLTRFGDGEFRLMTRPEFNLSFQKSSHPLRLALRSAIQAENAPTLLVGFPIIFSDVHWTTVHHEVWDQIEPLVDRNSRLGVTHVTRPVMFQVFGQDAVDDWRSLWEGKHAVIVTGQGSRFEMEPALFDGLASSQFIHSKSRDAFVDIERLFNELMHRDDEVVLISLGPTGSVLAHRLAQVGRQALDIGHLSSSYHNVLRGGVPPEQTPMHR